MIERHQIFLEKFIEHTTVQHTKFIASITENHMTFLQALTTAQIQQDTSLQLTLADQHRTLEELLSEQKLTRAAVESLLLTKRERSFTLEVDEPALKRVQKDPVDRVRTI